MIYCTVHQSCYSSLKDCLQIALLLLHITLISSSETCNQCHDQHSLMYALQTVLLPPLGCAMFTARPVCPTTSECLASSIPRRRSLLAVLPSVLATTLPPHPLTSARFGPTSPCLDSQFRSTNQQPHSIGTTLKLRSLPKTSYTHETTHRAEFAGTHC